MKYLIIIVFAFIGIVSCTFDSEEEYFANVPCDSSLIQTDTLMVYYEDLTYIFNGVCQQCHHNTFSYRPGINMQTYESVVESINTGKVLPAIRHESNYKMPQNLPKLSDCEIQRIEVWIKHGMPEE